MIRLVLALLIIASPALADKQLRWRLWIGDDATKYHFDTEEDCAKSTGRDPELICRSEMINICDTPARYDAMRDGVDCFEPPRNK